MLCHSIGAAFTYRYTTTLQLRSRNDGMNNLCETSAYTRKVRIKGMRRVGGLNILQLKNNLYVGSFRTRGENGTNSVVKTSHTTAADTTCRTLHIQYIYDYYFGRLYGVFSSIDYLRNNLFAATAAYLPVATGRLQEITGTITQYCIVIIIILHGGVDESYFST